MKSVMEPELAPAPRHPLHPSLSHPRGAGAHYGGGHRIAALRPAVSGRGSGLAGPPGSKWGRAASLPVWGCLYHTHR